MAQSTLPLSFAPLEGITGWLFRRVHHSRFPGLARYYTPFSAPTADSPLTGRGLNDVLPEHNEGVPVVPQLLTNKADDFISAARCLQDLGYNEVNLNLGCPSGTVTAKGKGAGMLTDPEALDRFLDDLWKINAAVFQLIFLDKSHFAGFGHYRREDGGVTFDRRRGQRFGVFGVRS